MRVYRSSYRLGRRAGRLEASHGPLVVMNAADGYADRLLTFPRQEVDLAGLGYGCAELDLRDFRDADPQAVAEVLAAADLLWLIGGNAFTLARAATAAGLRAALDLAPDLIVAGYSAGACLTGPDLAGIDLMDDAHELPTGYDASVPTTTLRLASERVVPHWGTALAGRAAARLDADGLAYLPLADGDDAFSGPWLDTPRRRPGRAVR